MSNFCDGSTGSLLATLAASAPPRPYSLNCSHSRMSAGSSLKGSFALINLSPGAVASFSRRKSWNRRAEGRKRGNDGGKRREDVRWKRDGENES